MEKGLKISELSKRTGVTKSTILYYVKMGLLPEPTKTSRNMAWYDESCVKRLSLIRELQRRKFIPLEHIKQIIDKMDASHAQAQMLIDSHRLIFEYRPPDEKTYTRKQMLKRSGLTEDELKHAERLEHIIPSGETPRPYDEDDIRQSIELKKLLDLGVSLERIEYYPRLTQEFIDNDLQLHDEITAEYHKTDPVLFLHTTEMMISAARRCREYLFTRMFQVRVRDHIEEEMAKGNCSVCNPTGDQGQ